MNTVDDAIKAFAEATDAPPNEALRWSLDHWDQAAPRFLALLNGYADGSDETDATVDALFFIVHLFGDRGDKRAYPALCKLMLDEDALNGALGDAATVETLKGIVIKCFDGDVAPLQKVVESIEAESITRGEALLILAWLARDGQWPEQSMRDYVKQLYRDMKPREPDYIWYNLVVTAAILGYTEFAADSTKMIKQGLVEDEWLTLTEFPELMATGDPEGKEGLRSEEVEPFNDVMTALAGWPETFADDEEEEEPEPQPDPFRGVGRNEPCPCGSGKKFKNCHLVAG